MNKQTQNFIENAGKATQKKQTWFDAYTGKLLKSDNDLDVTFSESCLFVAVILVLGFITYISLGA